jgi:hypothetical protein
MVLGALESPFPFSNTIYSVLLDLGCHNILKLGFHLFLTLWRVNLLKLIPIEPRRSLELR